MRCSAVAAVVAVEEVLEVAVLLEVLVVLAEVVPEKEEKEVVVHPMASPQALQEWQKPPERHSCTITPTTTSFSTRMDLAHHL